MEKNKNIKKNIWELIFIHKYRNTWHFHYAASKT